LLKSGAGAAALAFVGVPTLTPTEAKAAGTAVSLGFSAISAAGDDTVVVPPGYNVQVLYAWGDPIGKMGLPAGTPAWSGDAAETAAQQEEQSGAHHDGMHFFPFPARGPGGLSSTRGLLAMNHEYVDQSFLFSDGTANWSLAKVRKSQAAHGVSVIEVSKGATGWQVVRPSAFARRVTTNTPIKFIGPATNVLGTVGFGTVNNCANGYTPWGTYLTCEENFNGYFGATRINGTTGLPENDIRTPATGPATFPGYTPSAIDSRYGVNGPPCSMAAKTVIRHRNAVTRCRCASIRRRSYHLRKPRARSPRRLVSWSCPLGTACGGGVPFFAWHTDRRRRLQHAAQEHFGLALGATGGKRFDQPGAHSGRRQRHAVAIGRVEVVRQ